MVFGINNCSKLQEGTPIREMISRERWGNEENIKWTRKDYFVLHRRFPDMIAGINESVRDYVLRLIRLRAQLSMGTVFAPENERRNVG